MGLEIICGLITLILSSMLAMAPVGLTRASLWIAPFCLGSLPYSSSFEVA